MARPALGDGPGVTLSLTLPPALNERLRAFCDDAGYRRAEAGRLLLERGLDVVAAPDAPVPAPGGEGGRTGGVREPRRTGAAAAGEGDGQDLRSSGRTGDGHPGKKADRSSPAPAEKCRHPAPRVRNGFCFDCGQNVKGGA